MHIALYMHRTDNVPVHGQPSWEQFVAMLLDHEESPCTVSDCAGRECPWKSRSKLSGNPMAWSPVEIGQRRLSTEVISVSALILDLDHLTEKGAQEALARFGSLEHAMHTTHNHREDDHNWRVAVQLSHPVAAAQWRFFLSSAVRMLGVPADPSCKDLGRVYFRPSHPAGAPFDAKHVPGAPLDVQAVLAWGTANPMPQTESTAARGVLPEESVWDLDSDPVRLAIATIAANLPARRRHELALALGGMLRAHGATERAARYILHESYADGGSENPEARAATVVHTWALPEEGAMTGFTRVCEILGEDIAKEIGDCFADASNEAFIKPMLAAKTEMVAQAVAAATSSGEFLDPAIPSTVVKVRQKLQQEKSRLKKHAAQDQKIRGYILESLLDGEDLVPRILLPGGGEAPVYVEGHVVDRAWAIRAAMDAAARVLRTGTSFDLVSIVCRQSFSRMRKPGESANDVDRQAEREFLSAIGRKSKRAHKKLEAMQASDRAGRR